MEKAISRCLEPDPAKRPATALSVAAALPGGDFLLAALAAGETPSPDVVAASGKTEGLPLRYSLPMVVGLVALIAAVPFTRTNIEMHSLVPMRLSPDVLAAKIRDYAASFGYTAQPADRKYDLHWDWSLLGDARKRAHNRDGLRAAFAAEPPMQLGYRESPLPLIALPDGEVTELSPAPVISGMLEAWVNTKGELRWFRVVPPQVDASAGGAVNVDTLAKAIALPLNQWPEIPPLYTPLYAFDWIKAWKGRHLGLPLDVTVQASAWRGRITEVSVIWPGRKPGRMPESRTEDGKEWIAGMVERLTSALVILFSAFLAARNLKAGRGDLRGATRLASAILILMAAHWVCRAHWAADIGMIGVFASNASDWVTKAALTWLLYIALEPAVRARWPHALVTWTRVLLGQWQDARVAAHVLYGCAMGVAISVFFLVDQWYFVAHLQESAATGADVGSSARLWIGDVLGRASEAAEFGLLAVFAIFCFRVVLRKDWIASLAAAVWFTLREGDVWSGNGMGTFLIFLLIFAVLVFVVLRLGLVSAIAAIFVVNLLLQTPGAQNLTNPYEWAVILYPALAIAIVLWAFWRTSGQQLLAVKSEAVS